MVDKTIDQGGDAGRFAYKDRSVGPARRIKILARHQSDLCVFGKRRGIGRRGWVGLHQLGEQTEVGYRIHAVDLVAHGRFHVDRWIDLAGWRRVWLSI
jgi:hypothetical protein